VPGYRFSENRFRSYLEGRFSGLEKCLAQDTTAAPARPNKPAAEAKTAAPVKKSQTAAVEGKKDPATQETKTIQ
jgi:hypothetical protein